MESLELSNTWLMGKICYTVFCSSAEAQMSHACIRAAALVHRLFKLWQDQILFISSHKKTPNSSIRLGKSLWGDWGTAGKKGTIKFSCNFLYHLVHDSVACRRHFSLLRSGKSTSLGWTLMAACYKYDMCAAIIFIYYENLLWAVNVSPRTYIRAHVLKYERGR